MKHFPVAHRRARAQLLQHTAVAMLRSVGCAQHLCAHLRELLGTGDRWLPKSTKAEDHGFQNDLTVTFSDRSRPQSIEESDVLAALDRHREKV